jgi:hypothetical protein
MAKPFTDHGLEFLLDFDRRIHRMEDGYWLKFEIKKATSAKGKTSRSLLLVYASCTRWNSPSRV